MAALSFVTEHTREMINDEETRKIILEDAHIVESSLNYINDLLRSMLDINRARSGRIKVNNAPTDILHDILEPAAAILCVRGTRVEVTTECPRDLAVSTDQLRLKQVILNLAISKYHYITARAVSYFPFASPFDRRFQVYRARFHSTSRRARGRQCDALRGRFRAGGASREEGHYIRIVPRESGPTKPGHGHWP